MENYKRVRGMHDIMPEETGQWNYAEQIMTETAKLFNYKEIRTPVIEKQELFERSIGSDSDIISKEIYSFPDRKGRKLALRPEGTASVVRAFIESGIYSESGVSRLYYLGPMFRYDRPQKGRYRQFYQFGIEMLGSSSPFADGETIEVLDSIMKGLDAENHFFALNTLGCAECRHKYTEKIKEHLSSIVNLLCGDCIKRSVNSPLRTLDCKNSKCRELTSGLPEIQNLLCEECIEHFSTVEEYLAKSGVNYQVKPNLVRGLDYYTRTVFEVYLPNESNAIAAGGRYDSLVKDLGGPDIPAVGFAVGIERLLDSISNKAKQSKALYCICMGKEAAFEGALTAKQLRREGISVELDFEDRTLKSRLKTAGKIQADWCIIIGEREIQKKTIVIKNMLTGEQKEIVRENHANAIKEMILKC